MAEASTAQRLLAEGLGTALLLATVVGSGIMGESLAGGNIAIALLANSLATGAMLVVLIIVFGPVSGAHFNPAVSGVMLARNQMTARLCGLYIVAQVVGGILGVLAAHAMFGLPIIEISVKARTGPPQWFAEAVATFGLVMTILGTIHARPDAVPFTVGLYHRCILVYRVDFLRQPGSDTSASLHRHLCRYRSVGRCRLYFGAGDLALPSAWPRRRYCFASAVRP